MNDGHFHDRDSGGQFRSGMALDPLVPKAVGKEIITMIALGIIVLLLGAYLVYALVHPERF